MNGMKPNFLEGVSLPDSYYASPDPYKNANRSSVNLLEMSRYAKKIGKRLVDLTAEEVRLFSIETFYY